jgi:EAL domain-containing protein (putative c-di-GMP-specific phosphodiesterase class I)
LFAAPMLHEVEQRNALELALRQALAQGQFEMHYQPLMNAQGQLQAAEALLRWRKPDGEVISPSVFIPVCERSGLMVELGQWVIDAVAEQLHRWELEPGLPAALRFAINVSARQFALSDFPERLLASLHHAKVAPSRITLELTEGVLVDNFDVVASSIERLHQQGVRIELDDFGTGFSSLAYLRRLPIDGLKIDRSFIADAPFDARAASVVDAIFDVAERFSLDITAEGVETAAHAAFLSQRKIACVQGYLYTAPLSAAEFCYRYLQSSLP